MDDKAIVLAFLFSALEGYVAEAEDPALSGVAMSQEDWDKYQSVYERCGMGAVEVCRELGGIVDEMLEGFDPERPFCDLLYSDCDDVAKALYAFMREREFMPTTLNSLEL